MAGMEPVNKVHRDDGDEPSSLDGQLTSSPARPNALPDVPAGLAEDEILEAEVWLLDLHLN